MRLSAHARTSVRASDAWIAVAIVVVLLGSLGLYQMSNWPRPLPHISSWLWGGVLVLYWIGMLIRVYRHGRRMLTWQWLLFSVGYTLFVSGQLWVHPPAAVAWLANIGLLIVVGDMLLPYIDFSKKI